MKEINLTLSLYKEDDLYCIFMGDDAGSSGISIKEDTLDKTIESLSTYLRDYYEE